MASVVQRSNGRTEIQFKATDGKRKTIRLGKVSKQQANMVLLHVEAILTAQAVDAPVARSTANWLAMIAPAMRERFVRAGLCEGDAHEFKTVRELVDRFYADFSGKAATMVNLRASFEKLVEFAGPEKLIAKLTVADCRRFKDYLGSLYAESTANRRFRRARQLFKFAVDSKWLTENPFEKVTCGVEVNHDREHYVTRDVFQKLIDESPTVGYRAMLALMRIGGFRVCEVQAFNFSWVRWDEQSIAVDSPKTGVRTTPIFADLAPYLEDLYQATPEGHEGDALMIGTTLRSNWHYHVSRLLKRCGIPSWPRLFQNLRASRATELQNEGWPPHVCYSWLGHTEDVAIRHYLQVTSEHHQRAIAVNSENLANKKPQ